MTVVVTENYVPGCAECHAAIMVIVRSAVNDDTVTSTSLRAGRNCHCHPRTKAEPATAGVRAAGPTPNAPPPGELFAVNSAEAMAPNGFDPDR
jgi:hypothetical protein